jgi:hypothetical protein
MPRAPRILIEGGLYHVYNRFARGEEVLAETIYQLDVFLAEASPAIRNDQ